MEEHLQESSDHDALTKLSGYFPDNSGKASLYTRILSGYVGVSSTILNSRLTLLDSPI
jgi:hypothetical protein